MGIRTGEAIPWPDWYDGRGDYRFFKGRLIIAHPDHQPHEYNPKTNAWKKIPFKDNQEKE